MTGDARFWREWEKRKKQLRKKAPECTCGAESKKLRDHHPKCPYAWFWHIEFLKFKAQWEAQTKLEKFMGGARS